MSWLCWCAIWCHFLQQREVFKTERIVHYKSVWYKPRSHHRHHSSSSFRTISKHKEYKIATIMPFVHLRVPPKLSISQSWLYHIVTRSMHIVTFTGSTSDSTDLKRIWNVSHSACWETCRHQESLRGSLYTCSLEICMHTGSGDLEKRDSAAMPCVQLRLNTSENISEYTCACRDIVFGLPQPKRSVTCAWQTSSVWLAYIIKIAQNIAEDQEYWSSILTVFVAHAWVISWENMLFDPLLSYCVHKNKRCCIHENDKISPQ